MGVCQFAIDILQWIFFQCYLTMDEVNEVQKRRCILLAPLCIFLVASMLFASQYCDINATINSVINASITANKTMSSQPSVYPSVSQSMSPSKSPSKDPSQSPSAPPTIHPSVSPSISPRTTPQTIQAAHQTQTTQVYHTSSSNSTLSIDIGCGETMLMNESQNITYNPLIPITMTGNITTKHNKISVSCNFDPQNLFTFIHPTKTGGTSLEELLYQYYSKYFTKHMGPHGRNSVGGHRTVCKTANNPIIIIREPLDRFLSIYKYWKYGSKLFNRTHDKQNKFDKYTLNDFVELMKNEKKNKKLLQSTQWLRARHFSPIYDEWITMNDYNKTFVIRYSKDSVLFDDRFHSLLKYLKIKDKNITLPYTNKSYFKKNVSEFELSESNLDWIKLRYAKDIYLWNLCNDKPQQFRYVA